MYIDPGVLMPIASALAAIAGVIIMFWRRTIGLVRDTFRTIASKLSRSS